MSDAHSEHEQEIARLREALAVSEATAQNFLMLARHDLKAPVNALRTFAKFLAEDLKQADQAAVAKDLGYIIDASEKLTKQIDAVSALASARVGTTACELIDAGVALDAALAECDQSALASIEVRRASLPFVRGHSAALQRVWRELVDNALTHGAATPGLMEITCEARADEVVLGVLDRGPGVAPELNERVFTPFESFAGDATATGFGLALARALVEQQGGTLWLENAATGGAHLRFSLRAD